METFIVLVITGLAVCYIVRHFLKGVHSYGSAGCGCGGCQTTSGCSGCSLGKNDPLP